jgi:solute carrier family 25 S-adenosylmethionine transporter 26
MFLYAIMVIIIIGLPFSEGGLSSKDYMVCGGLSTAITDVLLFPVDTIKVTQQSTTAGLTMKQAIEKVSERGLGAFYKGALGYSFFDGFGAAIFFATYEKAKSLAAAHLSGSLLAASNYGSAGVAFVASSMLLVPAEVLKTRMQTQSFRCFRDCLRDAVSEPRGGLLGLYKGYKATLIRDLPYFALQLGFYGK